MRITNHQGLPEAFVRAVTRDPYNNHGTLSVTTLLRPPQMVRLEKEHWDEIEQDASDMLWTLFGQANHSALERTVLDGDMVEERLYAEVCGVKVSGQLDRFSKTGVLVDWKFTSVYSVMDCIKNGVKGDWENQLNMLAYLLRVNGHEPKGLVIVAACKDWRLSESKSRDDYPPKVLALPVPMWDHETSETYIQERVAIHTEETTIPCTDEERWVRPGKWAVMEKGKKKAVKLFDKWADAQEMIDYQKKESLYLEKREPVYVRCDDYCLVKKWCPQYNGGNQ